jgi:hypothetical protein
MAEPIIIDEYSCVPLHVELFKNGIGVSQATGFVVTRNENNYLITNWHVITGREPETGEPISPGSEDPDTIKIWHHASTRLGSWTSRNEQLLNTNGETKWLQHNLGRDRDVVALPLTQIQGCKIYPLDLNLGNTDLLVRPSEPVSIVGFPYGLASDGKFGIWKTGHIASDIGLSYDGKPIFLIDASTRGGMSGSPVFARRIGGYQTSSGAYNLGSSATRFLGVYSGRVVVRDVEIGKVWKPEVIRDILPQ